MMNMSIEDIEFKVAAKTARLIGRESISSAEGAIIELVKNSYDADAKKCSILIFSKYIDIPKEISPVEYDCLNEDFSETNVWERNFKIDQLTGTYRLLEPLSETDRGFLYEAFSSYNSIVIADNGDGMTSEIIKNHWMTIGTNAKEINVVTADGRVKSGAKGIGRFALDKLGHECQMFTKKNSEESCTWFVNWDDFENKDTLDEVTASLSGADFSLFDVMQVISENAHGVYQGSDQKGTLIHIKRLREFWPKARILKLYENLKSLLPPLEESDFEISLYSDMYPDEFGRLLYSDYHEYDWKLTAKIKKEKVELDFFPAEYDLLKFDQDFFDSELYKREPLFNKNEFINGKYSKEIDLYSLIPNSNNEDFKRNLADLGDLDFSVYFIKRAQSPEDKEKYRYKEFNQALRKKWFEQNGGVKIYRDKMRVRPYGIGSHFDWLGLDERAAGSPAAPNRKGQWRVRAHQVAGIAHISRINNSGIQDQSNREGLIENKSLSVFKNVLTSLIKELEYQRSYTAFILDDLYKKKNIDEQIVEKSDEIIRDYKEKSEEVNGVRDLFASPESDEKIDVLVKRAKLQNEKIDTLLEQNKILRVLASSGAMISSFAHDFKKMSNTLSSRHSDLIRILKMHDLKLDDVDVALNPFEMIRDMEHQDKKLNAWLRLTLDTLKQDRRKSKNVNLENYFSTLKLFWTSHLSSRGATLDVLVDENVFLKCFEIELDSIFNNLISNSYEAFKRPGFRGEKKIQITIKKDDKNIEFLYEDTGPGLSADIQYSNQIFEPLFTTKVDNEGNQIGTGLGMSLVEGSIEDLRGSFDLMSKVAEPGFELKIKIPV